MTDSFPISTGAKVVKHSRYVTFQMAEVTISKKIFTEILHRIDRFDEAEIEVNIAEMLLDHLNDSTTEINISAIKPEFLKLLWNLKN